MSYAHFGNLVNRFLCICLIIFCKATQPSDSSTESPETRSVKPNKISFPLLDNPSVFNGNQAYMAIRGNNFYTESHDYIITFSLNNKNGTLTNRQQVFADVASVTNQAPFNFTASLQNQLPARAQTATITQIAWVTAYGNAYLAARGYDTNLGLYIAIYTLDATTGSLTTKQTTYLGKNTTTINGMQWVGGENNSLAYLQTWGVNTQYNQYFLTTYSLTPSSGINSILTNPQTIFLPQGQSINQIAWTTITSGSETQNYLGLWGLDASKNLYFISTYLLDEGSGKLTQPYSQYNTLFLTTFESITQIEWTVIKNPFPLEIAYLAVRGYDTLSTRPFITIFSFGFNILTHYNEHKTLLLQQETCNQIEWVVVNNNAYLGIWGYDSLANNYYLSTFLLSPDTDSLTSRQKIFTIFGEMINFISWVTVKNSVPLDVAYLATRGYDNPKNKAFLGLYTFAGTSTTNEQSKRLTNLQLTFFEIQNTINQIEWTVSQNKAYLGVIGMDNLNNRFYVSTFTLNPLTGQLVNRYTRLATSSETFYQLEWVAF